MEQPINLSELMKYSLTPVPHSLGTPDGFLAKTDKSKIVLYLTHDVPENVAPPTDNVIYIQDGNAIIHMMKDLPPTFGLICLKLLDIVTFNKKDVIFFNWLIPSQLNQGTRKASSWCQWKIAYLRHKYQETC